jgi:hypothetical protein
VKDQDLIIGHALLSNNNFFTSIDNKVTSLIVLAIFTTVNSVILVQLVKLTELRAEHDWNFANHNSCIIKLSKNLLNLPLLCPVF